MVSDSDAPTRKVVALDKSAQFLDLLTAIGREFVACLGLDTLAVVEVIRDHHEHHDHLHNGMHGDRLRVYDS